MAGNYGLSREGFKRKRLPEIKQDLGNRISDKLGVSIQTGSNSLFGQLIGVFSYEVADLWEQAEETYNAMYPSTAVGESLSKAAGLAGIAQITAEQTTLYATCYGTEGTIVPYGAKIADSDNVTYSCIETEAKISAGSATSVQIEVVAVTQGTTYGITIDGTEATYTAGAGDSASNILAQLVAGFSFTDRSFSVNNNVLGVGMTDKDEVMAVSLSNLVFKKIGSPVKFRCDSYGAIEPVLGNINNIVTAVNGWESVANEAPANVGREAETDIALRQRWSSSVYNRATAMVEGIAARIYKNVTGVTVAKVYENSSDSTDIYGRPPHSIEAVVAGGDPKDICQEIWQSKAAGIDTYGSQSEAIDDSQGVTHTICFNRPEEVKVWLKIELGRNPEEVFPQAGIKEITEAVLKKGADLGVGDDVILQRFYAAIFKATTGIGYISVKACVGNTAGTYSADNISINPRQLAVFDKARIEVTMT